MSRSRRKNPVAGITTAHSEKEDKQLANRKLRRRVNITLRTDPDTEVYPIERDVASPWTMSKDGKARFDPGAHPERIRK